MGIQGLLKGLQGYSEKSNIRRFSNQSIAVDASSWLHKSVYSISEKYVESSERSKTEVDVSSVHVATSYVQKRCQELFSSADIASIYLVFDGKRCPLKAATNDDREERRQRNLKEARHLKKQGKRDKAEEKYRMCIKIHAAFADAVATALQKVFVRDTRLQCIFSPYEADAQLAKMCIDKIAYAIITEDSDVLVYSASCNISIPIIYKLDRQTGDCDVLSMDWLICPTVRNRPSAASKKGGALDAILQSLADRQIKRPGLGSRLFVQACVLAGSDYSPSKLNGIGLVSAFKLVRDFAHRPCNDRFRCLLDGLSKKNKGTVDMTAYETVLAQSEAVFYHHPVINTKNQLVLLTLPRKTMIVDGSHDDYHPLLTRFGKDLWFLGDIDSCRDIKSNPQDTSINHASQFPMEIVMKARKDNRENQTADHIKRRRVDDEVGANEALQLMKSVKNPYDKATRGSLEDITNKVANTNRFYDFAYAKAPPKKNDGYAIYVSNRIDLRFTKRKFNENGKPVNPNYAVRTSDIVRPAILVSNQALTDAIRSDAAPYPPIVETMYRDVDALSVRSERQFCNVSLNGFENDHDNNNVELEQEFSCSNAVSLRLLDEELSHGAGERLTLSVSAFGQPPLCVRDPVEDLTDPDQCAIFPHPLRSSSLVGDNNCSHIPEHADGGVNVMCLDDVSLGKANDLPRDDFVQSKYFDSNFVNPRRVTLEMPETPLGEFERAGTYVNLELSSTKRGGNPPSPGDDSVLSEVDEMMAAAIPNLGTRPRVVVNGSDSHVKETSLCRSFLRSAGAVPSTATPFQNNFNPIQRHGSRPSSSSGSQPKLYDVWDQTSIVSSIERRVSAAFKKKPAKNQITSYFGYQSVIAEPTGDDHCFLGL